MILPFADKTENLIMFVVGLFLLLVSMGTYRSPAVALMPDLTPKPLRSKANAVINLMGAVGGVYTLIMIKVVVGKGERPSYLPLFLSVAFWFIAYNAVTTAFSRYATHVWGLEGGGYADCLMIATVAAIISYIPIGMISSKIGRKKTIQIGILLLAFCFGSAGLYNDYHVTMVIFFGIIGFAWAAIGVNSYPMVVEMSASGDVGKYTGYYYTFSMAAQVVTPILSGALLEHVSYRTLFPYSVFFSLLAFCTMHMVKHGDSKPIPKKSMLENFDVDD